MAELIHCIECDHLVSTSAISCPSCGTKYTTGLNCKSCGKLIKHSEAKATVCSLCHEKIRHEYETAQYYCSVCKHNGPCKFETGYARYPEICPNCGNPELHRDALANCLQCGMYVRVDNAIPANPPLGPYCHKSCAWALNSRAVRIKHRSEQRSRKINIRISLAGAALGAIVAPLIGSVMSRSVFPETLAFAGPGAIVGLIVGWIIGFCLIDASVI
jgi:hypothetical protein